MLFITLLCLSALQLCQSYPIIFETDHNDRQCIDFNIPDGDDAHLLFIPLNDDIDETIEDWYVTQMSEITRHESKRFMKELDMAPSDIVAKTRGVAKSKVTVTVEQIGSRPPSSKTVNLTYFKLYKMQNIAEMLSKNKGWDKSRGQFSICITVRGYRDVRVLFDAIKISEYEEKMNKRHLVKKEHLTPIEEAFEEGITLAHSVIDEMFYMEKREIRMKQTTDGTNSRIRYFSYLSILVLLGVTWVQIQYLKNYFKKKKVL